MKEINCEVNDAVSEILSNNDLLNMLTESQTDAKIINENNHVLTEEQPQITQKMRYYFWKKIKLCLCFISYKIQTFAVLAEYNFKKLDKKTTKSKQEF